MAKRHSHLIILAACSIRVCRKFFLLTPFLNTITLLRMKFQYKWKLKV